MQLSVTEQEELLSEVQEEGSANEFKEAKHGFFNS
jgi:hypothetical protein